MAMTGCAGSSHRCGLSAAELQAKNERWLVVCANVFGLEWSHGLQTCTFALLRLTKQDIAQNQKNHSVLKRHIDSVQTNKNY
jgi:hypothetical protein